MNEYYLNIASIRACTEAEGPGKRFAIWCQGCLKRCPGCCNPEMQPLEKRHVVSADGLVSLINDARSQWAIEGVSLIGGEPFLQANGLAYVAAECKKLGLTVLTFTGYLLDELRDMEDESVEILLSHTDVLVDGPFDESQIDEARGWIGSKNQSAVFLSDAYAPGIEFCSKQSVEMLIEKDTILVNGWPYIWRSL